MSPDLLYGAIILAYMLAGHALADTWLQPHWLSRLKRSEDPDVRWEALGLHGCVHAMFVSMATGNIVLALCELVLHPLIDDSKARGWYGMRTDQCLHVLCKVLWTLVVVLGLA